MYFVIPAIEGDTYATIMRLALVALDNGAYAASPRLADMHRTRLQHNAENKKFPLTYKVVKIDWQIVAVE